VGNPGWIEPEEGWNPGWKPGQLVLDKRSDLLMEIVEVTCDEIALPPCASCGTDCGSGGVERYYAFRVVYFDDRTEPMNGSWRAPEDLCELSEMEIIAHVAR
jgi:hypothetical protein